MNKIIGVARLGAARLGAVKQRGFTALELIIVLVVGFSIIALSASKMGQLFSASSTASAMSSIVDLYSSARSLRGPTGYGTGDLLPTLNDAGMIPKGLSVTGTGTSTLVNNEWNKKITMPISADGLGFDIAYLGVPVEACSKLVQNLLKSGNFASITVGKTNMTAASVATPAAVVAACKALTATEGITMHVSESEPPPKP